jgi:hypothetical protein
VHVVPARRRRARLLHVEVDRCLEARACTTSGLRGLRRIGNCGGAAGSKHAGGEASPRLECAGKMTLVMITQSKRDPGEWHPGLGEETLRFRDATQLNVAPWCAAEMNAKRSC